MDNFLNLAIGFVVYAVVFSLPVISVVWLMRHRIGRALGAVLVAAAFALVGAVQMWRMEWFDIYRHGMPDVAYILHSMGPVVLVLGILGAATGAILARRPARRRQ